MTNYYSGGILGHERTNPMNAPLFDITRINAPGGSPTWVKQMIDEETRCCADIDARTSQLEVETIDLQTEAIAVEEQLKTEWGLFARIKLTLKLRRFDKQIEWRRKVLITLGEARLRRTMSW